MKPDWLDQNEYPFESQYLNVEGDRLHYIDAGEGEILLFVHGTPSWSFEYRNIIKDLPGSFRCIAIDHIGFGLFDKPEDYGYSPGKHSKNLGLMVDRRLKAACYPFLFAVPLPDLYASDLATDSFWQFLNKFNNSWIFVWGSNSFNMILDFLY
jgi:hypothetical protein